MIIGPDIEPMRERAKEQVMRLFVGRAEQDGTPPTLRALYVMKVAEAEKVVNGGGSALVEGEAQLRGYTPWEMAQVILHMAGESTELELARTSVNVSIENAASEAEIVAILDMVGIKFSLDLVK